MLIFIVNIQKIYLDNVSGKLSDNRFRLLADDYEKEQAKLKEKCELLKQETEEYREKTDNIESFIRNAKKYTEISEPTPEILNEMVKAVYVHKLEMINGEKIQDIDICYNFIGILPNSLLKTINNPNAQEKRHNRSYTVKIYICCHVETKQKSFYSTRSCMRYCERAKKVLKKQKQLENNYF